VQGLAKAASTHELHLTVLTGQFEAVKFLVEENNYNPMQRNRQRSSAVHIAALNGNLHILKYFITERNCNSACTALFMPDEMKKQIDHLPIWHTLTWINNADVALTAHRNYFMHYYSMLVIVLPSTHTHTHSTEVVKKQI